MRDNSEKQSFRTALHGGSQTLPSWSDLATWSQRWGANYSVPARYALAMSNGSLAIVVSLRCCQS